jgi:hypothetical protein
MICDMVDQIFAWSLGEYSTFHPHFIVGELKKLDIYSKAALTLTLHVIQEKKLSNSNMKSNATIKFRPDAKLYPQALTPPPSHPTKRYTNNQKEYTLSI